MTATAVRLVLGSAAGPVTVDLEAVYERYRGAVDDWPALVAAIATARPRVIWAHPSRIDRDALAAILDVPARPIAWHSRALAVPPETPIGGHWTHAAGLFYVQEEASMIPVRVLDPQPGECILDLCAAPGSKTAQIALALGNRGTLVANDRNAGRLAATSATIARLGLCNVTCTVGDGTRFPLDAGRFDAVLVDAPCSAEGGSPRKHPRPDFRERIARLQAALLERAASLCRPGGRIVYSTCSLAPEENEAVVDTVLREHPELRLQPIAPISGLVTSPGLTAWAGRRFLPAIGGALRTWPHRSGTGGFFVARLEKDPGAMAGVDRSTPVVELGADACESEVLRSFADHFGLGACAFAGHRILESGRFARLVADDHRVPAGVALVATGLPVTRNRVKGPKLSTGGALAFGRSATRQVVELSVREGAAYQRREALRIDPPADARQGYVLVRSGGHPLGLAQLRREGEARLVSEFPSAWVNTECD